MEELSADGLLSGGAVKIEQFLTAFQARTNEQLKAQSKEMEKLKTAEAAHRQDIEKLTAELGMVKQSYKDLNATVGKVSSAVENHKNSFAKTQTSVNELKKLVDGPEGGSMSYVREQVTTVICDYQDQQMDIDKLQAAQRATEGQLSTLQAAINHPMMKAMGAMYSAGQASVPQSSALYGLNGVTSSAPAAQANINQQYDGARVKPRIAPQQRTTGTTESRQPIPSMVSSFTLGGSPHTALTHQRTTLIMEEDTKEDEDHDERSSLATGIKRTSSERSSETGDAARALSLKRRRAKSNLKTTGRQNDRVQEHWQRDQQQENQQQEHHQDKHRQNERRDQHRSTTEPYPDHPSSEMLDAPDTPKSTQQPQFATNSPSTAEMENPLGQWNPRKMPPSKPPVEGTMRPPSRTHLLNGEYHDQTNDSSSEIFVAPFRSTRVHDGNAEAPASSQRRSGRAPQARVPQPGQIVFANGKVPDYTKGGN